MNTIMKHTNLVRLALVLMVAGTAASQTPAGSVTPGSFQTGTYSFPGNVGIGATAPAVRLQVAGSGAAPSLSTETGILNISGSPSQELVIGADSNAPFDMWLQVKRSWNDGTYWPLSLNPLGGNIGIGVTNPQTLLQIGNVSSGTAESYLGGLIQVQGANDIGSGSNGFPPGANGIEFKASSSGGGYGWKIFSPDRGNQNTPLSFAYRKNSSTWSELNTAT